MQDHVLANRYQLLTMLGQGGMGSVWKAKDLTLCVQVAVKLMGAEIADSPEALARFKREALAVAQLRSTHIVHINDYGVSQGTPFIVMDLLQGESLSERLTRNGRLTFNETAKVLSQVGRALALAHSQGIVHRDLKPDNLFIVREGDDEVVKVLDFGIAKKLDSQPQSGNVQTRAGELLGTPYYMSPEQAHGSLDVDHRTDIWSLGIIAYECLTGQRPFTQQTLAALLLAICSDSPTPPSHLVPLPVGVDEWFARTSARDPSVRFPSAAEAIKALLSIAERSIATATVAAAQTETRLANVLAVASQSAELSESVVPSSMNTGQPPQTSLLGWAIGLLAFAIVVVPLYYWTRPPWHSGQASPSSPTLNPVPPFGPRRAPTGLPQPSSSNSLKPQVAPVPPPSVAPLLSATVGAPSTTNYRAHRTANQVSPSVGAGRKSAIPPKQDKRRSNPGGI